MAGVVRFHETGGPEVLRLEVVEIPPPGKGEVQNRIRALGLNRAEVMFRTGHYVSQPRFPARPGYEAAGTVAAVGEGVKGFRIGDAVSVIPGFDLNDYGLYGDLANAPAGLVAHHPPALTIRGYSLMEVSTDPARLERGKRFVTEGLADGSLKPIIARTFPLEPIVEAHRYMESNKQFGKIVATVGQG
jgi:NADPH:quinone reductase-like Zn-dependent oxidoreductase